MPAMTRRMILVFGTAGIVLAGIGRPQASPPIAPGEVERIKTLVKPRPGEEKWNKIPWLTSLGEARRRAAAEGKPILLWEMDGHPLGCT